MKKILDRMTKLKMKWIYVIIFAVAIGVYTGAIMLVPALKDTSFQDIGIYVEWWVIFAVLIVVNCEKSWEAALKCFVFFLISQPVVYLTEILFGSLTFDLAKTYYFTTWLPLTIATLPGGFIAYFCKKQNTVGAVILGLGNTILLVMAVLYTVNVVNNFPRHILSLLVSLGGVVILTLGIQKEKKNRIIAWAVPVVFTAITVILAQATGRLNF